MLTCSSVAICTQVPISGVEGKYVSLCFAVNGYGPVVKFTEVLSKIYQKLKKKWERNLKLYLYPWTAMMHHHLMRVLQICLDGKTLNINVGDIIDEYGFEAWERFQFPFDVEKLEILAEKEKAKAASQTLE
jgi:nucleoredoxin